MYVFQPTFKYIVSFYFIPIQFRDVGGKHINMSI